MSEHGTHRMIAQLQDEDKWFGVTKRQLMVCAFGGIFLFIDIGGYIAVNIKNNARFLFPIAVFIAIVIILLIYVVGWVKIPYSYKNYGEGHVELLVWRCLINKIQGLGRSIFSKEAKKDKGRWI